MKKDYIIPTIFLIKYEEESKLLDNSLQGDADSTCGASDLKNINSMDGKGELYIDNTGNALKDGFAKKTGWLFDDNAFSDSW